MFFSQMSSTCITQTILFHEEENYCNQGEIVFKYEKNNNEVNIHFEFEIYEHISFGDQSKLFIEKVPSCKRRKYSMLITSDINVLICDKEYIKAFILLLGKYEDDSKYYTGLKKYLDIDNEEYGLLSNKDNYSIYS